MKKITNFVCSTAGRRSIPKNYFQHMSKNSKSLENVYTHDIFDFEINNKNEKEKRPVIWANAEELLDSVLQKRNLVGNCLIKIMADGGQGFFKICMTILPENYSPELDCSIGSDSEEDDVPIKKRKLYAEGGSSGKKAKLTSVHRLMLCIVPDIKETYENVKLLFDLTKINHIPFKFVSDFKLLLIVNGQQTATSYSTCPYCFVSLETLRDKEQLSSSSCKEEFESLKTFGDLKKDYQEFRNLGKNFKLAKTCHSTVNQPLFEENDEMYVLEKCVIPELHILQGFVNHVFWKGLVPLLGREIALLWPKSLKLLPKNYHGEAFEGNACRELLKQSDVLLKDKKIYGAVGKISLQPFVSAFKIMDKIVNKCFSTRKFDAEFEKSVNELKKVFLGTDVSETLKIHVILNHIKQCLILLGEKHGLGLWSEQPGESVHRVFYKYWEKYKINIIEDSSYPVRLKKAVVEFSSKHI